MPDQTADRRPVIDSLLVVIADVATERRKQDAKWGGQNHPDGTGLPGDAVSAAVARTASDNAALQGRLTWRKILAEEVFEAFAETDPALLRAELVQVAEVATAWVEAIDWRTEPASESQASEPAGPVLVGDGSGVALPPYDPDAPAGESQPSEQPIHLDDRAPRPTRSTKFQSAIAGRPLDLVSFRAGSGRQYEGERSDACPGDGVPGHRHYIGCIRPPSPPKPPAGRPQTFA